MGPQHYNLKNGLQLDFRAFTLTASTFVDTYVWHELDSFNKCFKHIFLLLTFMYLGANFLGYNLWGLNSNRTTLFDWFFHAVLLNYTEIEQ